MMSRTRAGLLVLFLDIVALPMMAEAIPPTGPEISATPARAPDVESPAQSPLEATVPAPQELFETAPEGMPAPPTAPGLNSGDMPG